MLSACVCLSVTLWYRIRTAKRRITQTMPHDSPLTLVFWCQRSWRNSNWITPYGGDKLKFVTFDEKRAITWSGTHSFQVRCFVVAGFDKCLARFLCNSRAFCYLGFWADIKVYIFCACSLSSWCNLYVRSHNKYIIYLSLRWVLATAGSPTTGSGQLLLLSHVIRYTRDGNRQ